ncbi:hypothetical protein EGW08_007076, partial [Elysia chlorotica]
INHERIRLPPVPVPAGRLGERHEPLGPDVWPAVPADVCRGQPALLRVLRLPGAAREHRLRTVLPGLQPFLRNPRLELLDHGWLGQYVRDFWREFPESNNASQ